MFKISNTVTGGMNRNIFIYNNNQSQNIGSYDILPNINATYIPSSVSGNPGYYTGINIGSPDARIANIYTGSLTLGGNTVLFKDENNNDIASISADPTSSSIILPSKTTIGGVTVGTLHLSGSISATGYNDAINQLNDLYPTPDETYIGKSYIVKGDTIYNPAHFFALSSITGSSGSYTSIWTDCGVVQGPKGEVGPKGDQGPTGTTQVVYVNNNNSGVDEIIYKSLTPGIENLNIGSEENKFETIFANKLNITNYILYRESFSLNSNKVMNINNYNLVLEHIDFNNNFIIEDDYYLYSGKSEKYLLNINLLYQWIDSELPEKFILGLYIQRFETNILDLIFNTMVGMDDFKQNIGLVSKKVKIDVNEGDKIYINLFKNTNKNLQINKNSTILLELFS